MEKKIKTRLFISVIILLIFVAVFVELDTKPNTSFTFDDIKNITVVGDPDPEILMFAKPCLMNYGDDIDVSVYVGKANSAEDAMYKLRTNAKKLSEKYLDKTNNKDIVESYWLDDSGEKTFVKYRTEKEKYSRNGWYITVTNNNFVVGEFFLSDSGILMPASRFCSSAECCI